MTHRLSKFLRGALLTGVGVFCVFAGVSAYQNLSTTGSMNPSSALTLAQVTASGATTNDLVTLGGGFISGASSTVVGALTTTATGTSKGLVFTGALVANRQVINNPTYTLVPQTDYYLAVSTTNLAVTLTLPAATSVSAGTEYLIKDRTGTASTNAISITAAAPNTIDATSTYIMGSNYGSIRLINDGATNWEIQ